MARCARPSSRDRVGVSPAAAAALQRLHLQRRLQPCRPAYMRQLRHRQQLFQQPQALAGPEQPPQAVDGAHAHQQRNDTPLRDEHSAQPRGQRHAVGDERRQVGQRELVGRHQRRLAPAVGFAAHHRQGRQALRREDVPGQQRQPGGHGSSRARGSAAAPRPTFCPPPTWRRPCPATPTATSRAARPGTSATQICQLKPIGANTSSSAWPSRPARL